MTKKISNNLQFYFTTLYPYKTKSQTNKKYTVYLGIGGNIGNTIRIFHKLFFKIAQNKQFEIIQTSPVLKNPPFGYLLQNDFYNAIIVIKTNLPPIVVLNKMQNYEYRFKRKRSFKNAPRSLDIDILYIKQNTHHIKLNTKRLTVPHLGVKKRESVYLPMRYITQ